MDNDKVRKGSDGFIGKQQTTRNENRVLGKGESDATKNKCREYPETR